MRTLQQIWNEGNAHYKTPICGSRLYQESEIIEWLEETHKEWIEKIQYEEMFVEEVIPRLVGSLKNVK